MLQHLVLIKCIHPAYEDFELFPTPWHRRVCKEKASYRRVVLRDWPNIHPFIYSIFSDVQFPNKTEIWIIISCKSRMLTIMAISKNQIIPTIFICFSHGTEVKPTYVIVDYKGKVQNMIPFGVTDPCFSWLPFLADLIPQLIPGQTIWYQICGRFLIGKEVEKIFSKSTNQCLEIVHLRFATKVALAFFFILTWIRKWEFDNITIGHIKVI